MKILKIITGLVFLFILLQGYGYINLMVSEKYETDETIVELSDMSDKEKQKQIEEIRERSVEIQSQKRNAVITGVVLLVIFIILCMVLINKSNTISPKI